MEQQVFFNLPLSDLEPIFKRWVKEVHNELQTSEANQKNQAEQPLTVQEAANFLGLTKATIYSKVSKRELPFMKRGKRLYFSQADLLEYIRDGRKQTTDEIKSEVHNYLKKGGKNA